MSVHIWKGDITMFEVVSSAECGGFLGYMVFFVHSLFFGHILNGRYTGATAMSGKSYS